MFSEFLISKFVIFILISSSKLDNFGTATKLSIQNSDYRWSAWSQFSLCSRSCGVGIKRRHRTCYRFGPAPIPVDFELCKGKYEEYQTCNLHACADNSTDFRSLQCSYFDGLSHKGQTHSWIPFKTGHLTPRTRKVINPCALICSSTVTSHFVVKFSSRVVDGTRCLLDEQRICIHGSCRSLGCDKKLHSDKEFDSCGICGGDNTACQPTSGSFFQNITRGYHDLLIIPTGSTNIRIKELANSKAVLALKSTSGIYFVVDITASKALQTAATKAIAGTRFIFRKVTSDNELKILKAKGPTTQTLTLLVFTREDLAEVSLRFEYTKATDTHATFQEPEAEPSYEWKTLLQSQMVFKKDFDDEKQTVVLHKNVSNSNATAPTTKRTTTTTKGIQTKKPEDTGSDGYETSAVESGIPEVTTRQSKVENPNENIERENGTTKNRNENFDFEIKENEMPKYLSEHDGDMGTKLGSFSENGDNVGGPKTLEIGEIQIRIRSLPTQKTLKERPITPAGYIWKRNSISHCSSTCTPGTQVSFFSCFRRDGIQVNDTFCNVDTRPDSKYHECGRNRCQPRWVSGIWGSCSGTCGNSNRTRSVRCWQMLAPGFDSTVPEYRCDQETKPTEVQNCSLDTCGPKWEMTNWHECSVMCGNGTQYKNIRCSTGNEHQCDVNRKPDSTRPCQKLPCTGRWYPENWSTCDGNCGNGVSTKRVVCRDGAGRRMLDSLCDVDSKPMTVQACGHQYNCPPTWVAQEWQQCMTPCGESHSKRRVLCGIVLAGSFRILPDTRCQHVLKPRMLAQCVNKPCEAQWYTTSFSECSTTCGEDSVRFRDVKCYKDNVPSDMCDAGSRPPEVEECNIPACQKSSCDDLIQNCHLLVKDLCNQDYYATNCCKTCGRTP